MTTEAIEAQILHASKKYADTLTDDKISHGVIRAAYMSGISQITEFMIGNDGTPGINPQNINAACRRAGSAADFFEGEAGQ